MGLDLSQFHESFFAESFEALDAMEASLLKLDVGVADLEQINTIFRGAHSMKGGAAMLGFQDVSSFTHTLETLLDELRSGRMQVASPTVDTLLKSVDVLREMLRAVQAKEPVDAQRVADVQFDLEQIVAQKGAGAASAAAAAPAAETPAAVPGDAAAAQVGAQVQGGAPMQGGAPVQGEAPVPGQPDQASAAEPGWLIGFKALPHLLMQGNDPIAIFAALRELGRVEVVADLGSLPSVADIDPQKCYLSWQLRLFSQCTRAQVEEIFDWTTGECELSISEVSGSSAAESASSASTPAVPVAPASVHAASTPGLPAPAASVPAATPADPAVASAPATDSAKPADAPSAAVAHRPGGEPAKSGDTGKPATDSHKSAADPAKPAADTAKGAAETAKHGVSEASSIRVGIDKIDELINTVGELVITQAMLSELGRGLEGSGAELLRTGLIQLERNMRQLQESVMRVRMLPISVAFSRFPRMVHDLAQRLNKKVELKLAGEQTELDKTVLEKIGDPLVHLVRNSIDHGIESPEARVAAGKPPFGTVSLNAYHSGGNIAVEVSDDGAGLDKARILAKARSRGLVGANDSLTDDQIHDLIFLPGFSTAEKTTEVSGRGVGMDVVKSRVKELGGSVEIRSERGKGSRFLITLPLTLSIVDGQSVAVGSENYIVPLTSIIESLQLKSDSISRLYGSGEVFSFRGEYLPIVRLHELFGIEPRTRNLHEGLVVVAEGDGRRIGLFVDELLGQQQVVIKSMESNYGHIEGIAGATILGDGSVALILDVPGLIRAASLRMAA